MAHTLRIEKHIEVLGTEITVDVRFTYSPAQPERGPTYDSGGEPATEAEVDILSASVAGMPCEWLADVLRTDIANGYTENYDEAYRDWKDAER